MSERSEPSVAPSRARRIAYFATTIVFCLGMAAGGVTDIILADNVVEVAAHLGYPLYFFRWLGVAKLAGALALLAPGFGRLKEWAYAGFAIDVTSAAMSHIAVGDPVANVAPPLVFFALGTASYLLRPADRRL